jgi:hypothetical protein
MLPKISGVVHGGQQPVSGATIQLYAANATTNQGASTPMLTTTVLTGSDGSFNITGDYTCPVSNPLVYLVSTGGNPGLGGTVNNSDIVLMAALGTCSSLTSSTYVVINELTTVAAVQALATFMTDATHIGSATSTNLLSIAGQFDQAKQGISLSTGQYGTNVSVTQLQLTTWANILAACVNTAGGTSGDGSPCGKLFQLAGGTDTITAALHMVQSPGNNASTLYGLIVATAPFQPYFTSVPSDLTVTVGFPTPPNIHTGTLDSNGHIWLYTGGYSYNTVTDTSTDLQGIVTVYDNNFNQLFTITTGTPGPGGLYFPVSMIPDASGHVFAMNANNTISEFGPTGTAISPAGGWSTGVATTFTGSGPGNGYVFGSSQVEPIRVDSLGNIWGVTAFGASNCYVEMNSSGTVITPVGTFCAAAGSVSEMAPDGSGNAWTYGSTTISKVNASGALAASAPNSPGCFDPLFTAFTANPTGYLYVSTDGIAYDYVHSQVWAHSFTGAGTITDGGTGVFCDSTSSTLPVIPPFASTSTTPGDPYSAGSLLISSGTLDGAGNLWFLTGGYAASGVVGSPSETFTGPVTFSTYLSELSPTGAVLTPFNTTTYTYGLQPSGVGVNATATATNGSVAPLSISVGLLGVDVNGNIWVDDILSNRIIKVPGAVANIVNY